MKGLEIGRSCCMCNRETLEDRPTQPIRQQLAALPSLSPKTLKSQQSHSSLGT